MQDVVPLPARMTAHALGPKWTIRPAKDGGYLGMTLRRNTIRDQFARVKQDRRRPLGEHLERVRGDIRWSRFYRAELPHPGTNPSVEFTTDTQLVWFELAAGRFTRQRRPRRSRDGYPKNFTERLAGNDQRRAVAG